MSELSADRVSAQRERQAWMAEAIVMMSRLCEEAEAAETERDEARKRITEQLPTTTNGGPHNERA